MGCCGDREKGDEYVKVEQRWDYIDLNTFKTKTCWTPVAYCWLWLMLIVSVSVYAVDTFTAINLIAFDKWSGQIKPEIPFSIARWIFAGCIIASFILLFYRWWRAIRVMRQGGVAKSYLDPLAVRVQCIRWGQKGRGYKRFLVFAELTKSRKGADYVALFSYFSFEAWLRIVVAEGPRQVVNAITLYSVMQAELIPVGKNAGTGSNSSFVQFWVNVGLLADEDKLQAAILLGMVWTLFIWILAAISLAVSVILYLIFLWHHIPAQDGTLSKYCRNKINRRMGRIVKVKVDKQLKKENELRVREEARAAREGLSLKQQPTLPNITADGDKYSSLPPLSRQDTMTTLPEYESRPGSIRHSDDSLPPMPGPFNDQRPGVRRHMTQASDASWSSYNSNAPLMNSAGDMGAQTPMSAVSTPWSARPGPARSATGFSQYSDRSMTPGPRPPMGPGGASYQMEPLPRPATSNSNASGMSRPGADFDMPLARGQTPMSAHPGPPGVNGSYFPRIPEEGNGRFSPAPGPPVRANTFQDPPTRSLTPSGPPPRSFTPAAGPPPRSFTPQGPPPRSYTPGGPPPGRSFTPGGPPPRSFTPQGPPVHRPSTSLDRPTLPRIETNATVASTGYKPFNPRSATPGSGYPGDQYNRHDYQPPYPSSSSQLPPQARPQPRPQPQPQPEYRSFSRPTGPGQRNSDSNRDSGVDDILSHY